jgi:hypothetical protein
MDDEEIPAAGFELDHRTCLVLLVSERVGRLVEGSPTLAVTPVRYSVTGDRVSVVGIDGGLPPGRSGDRIVLEVDGIDEQRQVGWSVVVRGYLETSASAGQFDITELALTGRWVRGSYRVPPSDDRGYL